MTPDTDAAASSPSNDGQSEAIIGPRKKSLVLAFAGSSTSLNCQLGTETILATSTGPWAAAMPFCAILEVSILRRLYERDHMTQVLATFAIILIANEVVRMIWGSQPLTLNPPAALAGPVELLPGFSYPAFRLLVTKLGPEEITADIPNVGDAALAVHPDQAAVQAPHAMLHRVLRRPAVQHGLQRFLDAQPGSPHDHDEAA